MRNTILEVHLYYSDNKPRVTKKTESIEQARQWIKEAESGRIFNSEGIPVM